MFEIEIKEQAERELWEIGNWYKSESEGLDLKFLNCFEKEIELIRTSPFISPMYRGKIRKVKIKQYPYSIYFVVTENVLLVLAIIHSKRSNKFIKSRLKK